MKDWTRAVTTELLIETQRHQLLQIRNQTAPVNCRRGGTVHSKSSGDWRLAIGDIELRSAVNPIELGSWTIQLLSEQLHSVTT